MIPAGKIRFTKPIISGPFTFEAGTLASWDGSAKAKIMIVNGITYTITLTLAQRAGSIEAAP